MVFIHSNTTLVKVKLNELYKQVLPVHNSNTTLVKVKYWLLCGKYVSDNIQIQLLLKLNILADWAVDKIGEFKYNSC